MVDWITQVLANAEGVPQNPDDRGSFKHLPEEPEGGAPERRDRLRDLAPDDSQ